MTDADKIFWAADYNKMSMRSSKVNLRPIHALCALLPEETEAPNSSVEETLTLIDAAIFHVLFPIREALSAKWFDEHPIHSKETDSDTQTKGMNLLEELGLVKKVTVERRF